MLVLLVRIIMEYKKSTPTPMTKLFFLQIGLVVCRIGVAVSSQNGYITPNGDIRIKKGEDLEMNCTLNRSSPPFQKHGENAYRYMAFKVMENNFYKTLDTSVLNNGTTIGLHIKNVKPVSRALYKCDFKDDLNDTVLDYSYVTVAHQPEVTDFQCHFFDLTELTCTWTDKNYFKTDYQLNYTSTNDISYEKTWFDSRDCTSGCRQDNKIYICAWNCTDQCYNDLSTNHKFTLIMKDEKDRINSYTTEYNQWENVIPDSPILSVNPNQTTSHSIGLTISLKAPTKYDSVLYNPKKWINYTVDISIMKEDQKEIKHETIPLNATTVKHNVTNLPYANTKYVIEAAITNMKSKANSTSPYARHSSSTNPKRPDRPPRTTLGSFHTDSTSVKIYWEEIKENEKNGDNFSYYIEEETNLNLNETSYSCLAAFNNVTQDRNLNFKIWSQNEIGRSADYSEIYVPAKKYRGKSIQKLSLLDDETKEYYIFLWDPPPNSIVRNFTVYWCKVKMGERKNSEPICEGNFHWAIQPNSGSNVTISRNATGQKFQFAIAVNYSDLETSEMSWTNNDCIFPPFESKEDIEISNTIRSDNLEIRWKSLLDTCAGVAPTFYINYCSQDNKICENLTTHNTHYTIEGLDTDLLYNLNISMNSTILGKNVEAFGSAKGIAIDSEKMPLLYFLLLIIPALIVLGYLGCSTRKKCIKIKEDQPNPTLTPLITSVIASRREANGNIKDLRNNTDISLAMPVDITTSDHPKNKYLKMNQPSRDYVCLGDELNSKECPSLSRPISENEKQKPISSKNNKKPVIKGYVDTNFTVKSSVPNYKHGEDKPITSKNNKKSVIKGYVDEPNFAGQPPDSINKYQEEKPITLEITERSLIKGCVNIPNSAVKPLLLNYKHEEEKPISSKNSKKSLIRGYVDAPNVTGQPPGRISKYEEKKPITHEYNKKSLIKEYVDTLNFTDKASFPNNKYKEENPNFTAEPSVPTNEYEQEKTISSKTTKKPVINGYVDAPNFTDKPLIPNNKHEKEKYIYYKQGKKPPIKGYVDTVIDSTDKFSSPKENNEYTNVKLKNQNISSQNVSSISILDPIPPESATLKNINGFNPNFDRSTKVQNTNNQSQQSSDCDQVNQILPFPNMQYVTIGMNYWPKEDLKPSLNDDSNEHQKDLAEEYLKDNSKVPNNESLKTKKERLKPYSLVVPLKTLSNDIFGKDENNLKNTENFKLHDDYIFVEYEPDVEDENHCKGKENTEYLDMSPPDEYVPMKPPYVKLTSEEVTT